jgi:hypothetical protein
MFGNFSKSQSGMLVGHDKKQRRNKKGPALVSISTKKGKENTNWV